MNVVGVFGGTFDPVHIGHLVAAEEVHQQAGLAQVIFVPNRHQPLKGQSFAAPPHRVAMLQLAVKDNPVFRVNTVEIERDDDQPSYTLHTLRRLRAECAEPTELVFILGLDALNNFPHWHAPADILAEFYLIAMTRSGQMEPHWDALEHLFPTARARIRVVQVPDIDISATDLRHRLATGRSVRYQIPADVDHYIRAHDLYDVARAEPYDEKL